jgi:hypothetical protein
VDKPVFRQEIAELSANCAVFSSRLPTNKPDDSPGHDLAGRVAAEHGVPELTQMLPNSPEFIGFW